MCASLDQPMMESSGVMPKLSIGSSGNHHRTLNAGSNSNPHSALRTKENNNCQPGGTISHNDQLKGNKRNTTFYQSSNSSNQLHKIVTKTHAHTNRNLSFNSTNSTRLISHQQLGAVQNAVAAQGAHLHQKSSGNIEGLSKHAHGHKLHQHSSSSIGKSVRLGGLKGKNNPNAASYNSNQRTVEPMPSARNAPNHSLFMAGMVGG